MSNHANKIPEKNKENTVFNDLSKQSHTDNPDFQLTDNRPVAIAQRKLQGMINNSPKAKQLQVYQEMANNSARAKNNLQLQALANNRHTVQQKSAVIQTKPETSTPSGENKTGMPDTLKSGIEDLSGMDVSDVKVHYNSDKPAQLNAHAYAQGKDIHLASGQEKHLPHEAWHVIQQKQGRVKPTLQMKGIGINDDRELEREADIMGAKALQEKTDDHSTYQKKSHRQQEIASANAVQREEKEEEKENAKGSKHKEEEAWKLVQLKKKPGFPNDLRSLWNLSKAPVQGKWINREDGHKSSEYSLLQWKQTPADDKIGHYLEDGWYKAKRDYRTYWAIKLKGTEIEDIKVGRQMVWVRPWVITINYPSGKTQSAAGQTDLSKVFVNIREIWKQSNIGIQTDKSVAKTITLSKEPEEYAKQEDLVTELNDLLRGDINAAIEDDSKREREGIQAVFVPSYDRMGFTYHKGNKGYKGPVTFASTGTIGVGKDVLTRDELSSSDYTDDAISLDAAHEIGHAFGLKHAEKQDEVRLLMHKALYHSFLNADKQKDEKKAKEIAGKNFKNYPNPLIFKTSRKGEPKYWTLMHGAQFTPEQIELVLKNIKGKEIWK